MTCDLFLGLFTTLLSAVNSVVVVVVVLRKNRSGLKQIKKD